MYNANVLFYKLAKTKTHVAAVLQFKNNIVIIQIILITHVY